MGTPHRYKELRLGQMRAFCAVARHRSFAAAARALGVSHTAVLQQVRALERDFGVALFERDGRELVRTADGERFHELAGGIVAAMDSVRQVFDEGWRSAPVRLVVAGTATLFVHDLAALVAEFRRREPRVRLSLLAHHNAEIEQLVADGEADVGVVPHGLPDAAYPRLVAEEVCRRDWHLFAPAGHPLIGKARVRLADLARTPLVLAGPGTPWRRHVDAAFERAGLVADVAVEVNTALAAFRYAGLGLGATLFPWSPRVDDPVGLARRSLAHLFPSEHLIALWRKGATPRPPARLFIDFARERLAGG